MNEFLFIGKVYRVTLKDIADAAGVSKMTVSLALRDDPRISESTRERVAKVGREMGYKRNPYLTALSQQIKSSKQKRLKATIAYLGFFDAPSKRSARQSSHDWLEDFYIGAKKQAEMLGFGMERFNPWKAKLSEKRLNEILISRGILGIIIHPPYSDLREWDIDWERFSVCVNNSVRFPIPFHTVGCGRHEAMIELIDRARELGYRKIGLVLGKQQDDFHAHVQRCAISDFQLNLPKKMQVPHCIEELVTKEVFYDWLDSYKPELVVAGFDEIYYWMKERGYSIPGDIGLVRPQVCGIRSLSGMKYDHQAVGAAAVDLISGQMNRNERGIPSKRKQVFINAVWNPGETIAKLR
ncbi:MAG: LacI family DNA-binding transcriptional regulator [Verrucomicrobiota bacterium]